MGREIIFYKITNYNEKAKTNVCRFHKNWEKRLPGGAPDAAGGGAPHGDVFHDGAGVSVPLHAVRVLRPQGGRGAEKGTGGLYIEGAGGTLRLEKDDGEGLPARPGTAGGGEAGSGERGEVDSDAVLLRGADRRTGKTDGGKGASEVHGVLETVL